ncbi:hypothetical protein [Streptococcus bouchesdurhonensis]|uniref:hypothetical protein n=1 Tax=Streptococcus bouchesdurhonensis TaxID=2954240 RepID=UPI0021C2AD61|nr:hypothetical protein [Streptococcus bouchesdurhonensis]
METLQTIETKIDKLIEQNKKAIEMTEAELVKANQAISDAQAKLVQAQKEINSENTLKQKVTYGRQNVQKNFMRDVWKN